MTMILILMIVVVFIYLSISLYLNHIIDSYLQNTSTHHLHTVGVDEKTFIGLHKKNLDLEGAYMIYARKTTAYKGVIVFNPDWNYNYQFYNGIINFLCRQGYIIVTYQTNHTLYTGGLDDLKVLMNTIEKDEVLSTYPLSAVGHGTGAYTLLCFDYPFLSKVLFHSATNELDVIYEGVKYKHEYIYKRLRKMIQKKYHIDLAAEPQLSKSTYMINGENNTLHLENVTTKTLTNSEDLPFLSRDSEQYVHTIQAILEYEGTSQFDYKKTIEKFDCEKLCQLNQEVLDILPYLFEYEEKKPS